MEETVQSHAVKRLPGGFSAEQSLVVMQDEQSPFNSQFLVACHGYTVQVEGLEEGESEEQEWDFVLIQTRSVTRKIS